MGKDTTDDRTTDGKSEGFTRRGILSQQQGGTSNRRNFVGGVLGSVTATLAATTSFVKPVVGITPAKRQERKVAAREYHSTQAVEQAVANHATDALAELADNGVLDNPSMEELPTETLYGTPTEYAEADEGTVVFGVLDDGAVIARIQIKKGLSDHRHVVLVIVPAREHSFAVVESETPIAGVNSRTGGSGVVTQDCGSCYYDEYCWVGCAPDSCECLIHKVPCCTSVGCDGCCYVTNTVCTPCSEDGQC